MDYEQLANERRRASGQGRARWGSEYSLSPVSSSL
jgi:hypothetical protein